MKSTLSSPFQHDMKPAPSPHSRAGVSQAGNPGCVATPSDDYGVLSAVFYVKTPALEHTPAALNSPMGTAIPGIGHSIRGK